MAYKFYTLDNKFIKESDFFPISNFTGILEYHGGTRDWYFNGKIHRLDEPAVVYHDGATEWYVIGRRHRIDGAALEWPNGYKEWWIYGKRVTELEYKLLCDMMKLKNLL